MSRLALAIVLCCTALLVSCAGQKSRDAGSSVHPVTVFYGTNRNVREAGDVSKHYGLARGGLEFGKASLEVSRPEGRGQLLAIQPTTQQAFIQELSAAVAEASSPEVFIFIHGYLRSFSQVSRKVAAFADNTAFPGVAMMWSWPSSRSLEGYLEDETNMRWSQPHFLRFLREVLAGSGAEKVHLVGHSLGGRALVELTVQRLIPEGDDLSRIGQYVLLAPDIDTAIFLRDQAPALRDSGLSVTLYTSANDKAMASARGLRSYPRLGDSKAGVVTAPGIETVDVTAANRSILGHSYFDESEWVAEDLALLLREGRRAEQRPRLLRVEEPEGTYWRLLVEE